MAAVPEYFGSLVFDDRARKANLPADVYRSMKKTINKGANEAPPAVVSMFPGDELAAILGCIEHDAPYVGVDTGNKFEFRMVGSADSIACANITINTAVAESLKIYADRLEGAEDFEATLQAMIRKTIQDHKRIIFNGNGYNDAWIKEATEQRGLRQGRNPYRQKYWPFHTYGDLLFGVR